MIGLADENLDGVPLLEPRMRGGARVMEQPEELATARRRATEQLAALPPAIRDLAPADPPYPVEVSDALAKCARKVAEELADRGA